VLALQERGTLKQLKIKWWKELRGGGTCSKIATGSNAQLSLSQLGGVFIVLVSGAALCGKVLCGRWAGCSSQYSSPSVSSPGSGASWPWTRM
jgi:hypothetical protein